MDKTIWSRMRSLEAYLPSALTYGSKSFLRYVPLCCMVSQADRQIIARVQSPRANVSGLIVRLLHEIGKAHPQALIYPLTVASKSNVPERKRLALLVMNKMKEHSSKIVEQAQMVSTELIRAAILWHEMWYDGLEEASKYYFADGNIPGMFEVLEPLHEMVEAVSLPYVP
jgi:FKBP12-rapamycin complex-associated protein